MDIFQVSISVTSVILSLIVIYLTIDNSVKIRRQIRKKGNNDPIYILLCFRNFVIFVLCVTYGIVFCLEFPDTYFMDTVWHMIFHYVILMVLLVDSYMCRIFLKLRGVRKIRATDSSTDVLKKRSI